MKILIIAGHGAGDPGAVAKGQTVTWYGYYCKETESNAVWYYVQTKSGKTGYASAQYLKK